MRLTLLRQARHDRMEGVDRMLARRFSHEALLAPLAKARDPLDGLHANTQVPKVVGFQRVAEVTGDAAAFYWRTVTRTRSFATGMRRQTGIRSV
ncbi:glycoside hydrolase family 127 protein [Sphingomonas sp. RP10(2022)]|uniref:Glycoside hydrolase family 127 protein n=1 Tax=Sphingomonas liriopis TaxID=2949094 RepID=A0A9X2HUV5_9SPHN|nr:beta-L-arabinofuranosidase domain-containing protein [Sphingomonas liriopis]MCP3733938.1 glycoside hydrolase family 127 protein [Sphingomonas liriopis]